MEVAVGVSLTGARSIGNMKHVGLYVAAYSVNQVSYIGTSGELVLCVADDLGMHSSQNHQDIHHYYARFPNSPLLEPSDS